VGSKDDEGGRSAEIGDFNHGSDLEKKMTLEEVNGEVESSARM
jgi:hypothetical protein